ncbi:MAG: NifU family protein [Bacillales bacterium]|jgi:Fe-S cluster biogenesis protein NfuA|nr:NifU family protein [Bacillales bacterium]
MTEQEKKIIEKLEKIRPFLVRDGGDVEFVSFKDGIVYIRMQGACVDCLLIDNTLKDGIEVILTEEVEGVLGVELYKEV